MNDYFLLLRQNRKLEVSVNGTKTVLKDLNSNNEVKSVTIPVSLKQGYNTVQMGNNFGWAPDIDRLQYPDNNSL